MANEQLIKLASLIGSIILGIGIILLVILLPLSFSYLDFYEYGFVKRRTTSKVDTSKIYDGGRHLIGPDFQFKTFYSAAQFIYFSHIPIFTKDNLEVKITAELQYFLIKDDLKLLHDSYDVKYHPIIVNNARDAIKNSITKFDTDEFISNRSVIQNDLYLGVRRRLSGICCLPNCKTDCRNCKQWELCDIGCKPRNLCTNEERGFYVEVRYLQLHDIDIPLQVNERKLLSLIRDLEKEKEQSVKEEMIVRKKSEYEVAKITNLAKEIVENAKASYNLMINQAESNYSKIIEDEHNTGLQKIFKELGLTSSKHKSSINYLRSLRSHEKIKYSIDFNTLIANTR